LLALVAGEPDQDVAADAKQRFMAKKKKGAPGSADTMDAGAAFGYTGPEIASCRARWRIRKRLGVTTTETN
jgi:hypothetical protein